LIASLHVLCAVCSLLNLEIIHSWLRLAMPLILTLFNLARFCPKLCFSVDLSDKILQDSRFCAASWKWTGTCAWTVATYIFLSAWWNKHSSQCRIQVGYKPWRSPSLSRSIASA